MRRSRPILLGILLVSGGCQTTDPPGLWYGPQTPPKVQQQQAQRIDPYPLTETGPEIVGGRPPGYDRPPAEVRRDQTGNAGRPDRWFNFGGN